MSLRQHAIKQELLRLDGELGLPKHQKMASNPFVFLRGSAQLFYYDLANSRLSLPDDLFSLPLTTIQGDCHISNFGFITEEGSHGDKVVFTLNDFDDACIGHAAWDISRFIVSMLLTADYCQGLVSGHYQSEQDYSDSPAVNQEQTLAAVSAFLEAYINQCAEGITTSQARNNALDQFNKPHILAKLYKKALKRAGSGDDYLTKSALAKSVDLAVYPLSFKCRPGYFQTIAPDLEQELIDTFSPYVDDTIIAVTQRLNAGTGSNNMQRYYLLVGPTANPTSDEMDLFHIVEVKKQRQAAPLFHFSELSPVNSLNPAHLTAVCQRRMQRRPDLVLDEVEWQDAHWLVRSRHHARVGVDPEDIGLGKKAANGGLTQYAQACGKALAMAHARGDRRSVRFETAVCEVFPTCQQALIDACTGYVKQVVQDRELLLALLSDAN